MSLKGDRRGVIAKVGKVEVAASARYGPGRRSPSTRPSPRAAGRLERRHRVTDEQAARLNSVGDIWRSWNAVAARPPTLDLGSRGWEPAPPARFRAAPPAVILLPGWPEHREHLDDTPPRSSLRHQRPQARSPLPEGTVPARNGHGRTRNKESEHRNRNRKRARKRRFSGTGTGTGAEAGAEAAASE
jgi:hypothetical protein